MKASLSQGFPQTELSSSHFLIVIAIVRSLCVHAHTYVHRLMCMCPSLDGSCIFSSLLIHRFCRLIFTRFSLTKRKKRIIDNETLSLIGQGHYHHSTLSKYHPQTDALRTELLHLKTQRKCSRKRWNFFSF